MNYAEELRQSRNKPQVAFTEFANATRKNSENLFCFFEGKDNAYYVSRIKRFTEDYYPVRCGGKQSVLDVYSLITGKEEYKKYKLGFFIDRDFDSSIGDKNPPIFETPCYSIENLYVSISVFKEILTNEFQISEASDSNFGKLVDLYEQRQKEFHHSVLLFNSWYSCLIEKKENEKLKTGVTIDDKLPKNYVEISLNEVKSNYDFQKIKETFPNAIEVDYSIIEKKMEFFQSQQMHKVFRGKYELEFLVKIIQEILKDSRTEKKVVSSKIDFAFGDGSNIGQQQSLNIFEAYAETPKSLLDYLKFIVEKE
ncbi:MAG: DUF4435 domain-containing protein [Bacteroidales bacterium]|nr:DUF4435 domain-containing protein [Bacteroidales bacterium]